MLWSGPVRSGCVGSVLKGSEQFGTIEPRCWTEWIGYLWPDLLFDRLTVMIIYQCNAVPLFYWRCKSPLVLGESPEWSNNTQPHNIPFLDQTLERRPAFGCCIVTNFVKVKCGEPSLHCVSTVQLDSKWSNAIQVDSPYLNILTWSTHDPAETVQKLPSSTLLRRPTSGSLLRGTRRCLIGCKAPCMRDHPPFCSNIHSLPFEAHPEMFRSSGQNFYPPNGFHNNIYGSFSPGREKWAICGICFWKK